MVCLLTASPATCSENGKNANIFKYAAFFEAFFTAPNGMMEYIDDDGEIRYRPDGKNQENFSVREDMLQGIIEYFCDIEKIKRGVRFYFDYPTEWADNAFGILMNGAFEPTERMREGFYYDNGIAGRSEFPIWG